MPPDSLRIFPDQWLSPLDWGTIFKAPARLEIDLGFGKGRFLLERARAHPDTHFLGVERMLKRTRKVDSKACRAGLGKNTRLLRIEGSYFVRYLVPPESVDGYYILFPDPWPKERYARNRIMGSEFLSALHRSLKPGAFVHFATDHLPYFDQVVRLVSADPRFEALLPAFRPRDAERSDFELLHSEKLIGRYSFRRKEDASIKKYTK